MRRLIFSTFFILMASSIFAQQPGYPEASRCVNWLQKQPVIEQLSTELIDSLVAYDSSFSDSRDSLQDVLQNFLQSNDFLEIAARTICQKISQQDLIVLNRLIDRNMGLTARDEKEKSVINRWERFELQMREMAYRYIRTLL